jgi:LPXTG-motif cell wall-anchored protein
MQWVTNMIKTLNATDMSVVVGETVDVGVNYVTYGGFENAVSASNLIVTVLDGSENVTIEDGKITANALGDATVMYGYKTVTTSGSEYVVYSQPVKISVVNPVEEAVEKESNAGVIIAIVAGVIAVAGGLFVFLKKKK